MDTLTADLSSATAADSFRSFNPATGEAIGPVFRAATFAEIQRAAEQAADSMRTSAHVTREQRALFLEACAANLSALGDSLVSQACEETGLTVARIASERDRTVYQLRMFARIVREGSWVDAVIDHGDQTRAPIAKPDLRRMLRPLGPVSVFGASNFPLAYSVAGGDTASALAAGCPVVVKGHSAHPCTSELVAAALSRAVRECGLHPGTFSLLQAGGAREIAVGSELVMRPEIKAVGFTGSVSGGTALVALAMKRPIPIPVFAEMGSVNPVVILPGAIRDDAATIARLIAASALNSGGQMCTCPGLIFVLDGSHNVGPFVDLLAAEFNKAPAFTLLTARTRDNLRKRRKDVAGASGVSLGAGKADDPDGHAIQTNPSLYLTSGDSFIANPTLREECFGPSAILVRCTDEQQLLNCLDCIQGSLTGTLVAACDDRPLTDRVLASLQQRVGRLIYNGVPTGVEVCDAMVHSGPFPACSRPDTTAVGSAAIRRWCRAVCYQNFPDDALPQELKEANPLGLFRIVDGQRGSM